MGFLANAVGLVALFASVVRASPATHTPSGASGFQVSVAVPSSVASSGSGDIFLQLTAPTTYRWVAMGIGSQMAGSTIFLIYADGNGNVTISPRDGKNHVEPNYDSSIKVELLAGSGISGNTMKANLKYTLDSSILQASSSSTNWIAAWQTGNALDSTSPSATITQHDNTDQYTFDLTKAVISSDSNPYYSTAASSSGSASGTATGTGSSSSSTSSSSSGGSGGSGGSGDSGDSGSSSSIVHNPKIFQKTHGIIMGASFVVLLPIGGMIMNLFGAVWIHAGLQMLSLFAIIAAFGLGIHLAKLKFELFKQDHTILGLVVVVLLIFQPILGFLHHRQYQKLGRRSYFGHVHLWYGRLLIILGIINGGLGLRLANNSKKGEIAYAVVAAVMFVAYMATVLVNARKGSGSTNGRPIKREQS